MANLKLVDVKNQIYYLVKEINYHDDLYYNKNYQEISDEDYDKLRKKLYNLEKSYPHLKHIESPSEKVGSLKKTNNKTFIHSRSMLSLNNAYTEVEVEKFYEKARSLLGNDIKILAETKVDGLSASLKYKNRKLVLALTRGDGYEGEDITNNVLNINGVKETLPSNFPEELEIRGEIFMPKDVFANINKARKIEGLSLFSTPRNAAAGSVRQIDPNVTRKRNLSFFGYTIIEKEFSLGSTVNEIRKNLAKNKFNLNEPSKLCSSLSDMISFHGKISNIREKLNYDIDGIVYKVNSLSAQLEMGETNRWPRWALAHKFAAEIGYTKVENVIFQVGRTGSITPVAVLKEIKIGGVNINRATLHNEDEIKRLDLKIGDIVSLKRAGDVIPKITGVVKENRNQKTIPIKFPTLCPCCKSKLVRKKNESAIRCENINNCTEQRVGVLSHFISRHCFNIDGLGDSQLRLFWENNFIKNFEDIFTLQYRQESNLINIKKLIGWGDKSLNNLFKAINISRNIDFEKFLFSLGIRHIGQNTAHILSKNFSNIDTFLKYFKSKKNMSSIAFDGIGEIILKSLFDLSI